MTKYWLDYDKDTDFPIQNLPYGVFKLTPEDRARCGVAIGDYVLDLLEVANKGLLSSHYPWMDTLKQTTLNDFMSLGKDIWQLTRKEIIHLLTSDQSKLLMFPEKESILKKRKDVTMCLPAHIGDYTDFYSSLEHATNVGTMFRGKDNALQPNWKHLPVAYHGRSSSVVISGTPIIRPRGQLQKNKENPKDGSIFSTCKLLDFELEMGCFLGSSSLLGQPITMENADKHIFGYVLMNDWSARDIQKWEYIPLGPFTAKNFGTTISPWIVTPDALEAFKTKPSCHQQDPQPLPYLQDPDYTSYNIQLSVALQGESMDTPSIITKSNFKNMYWNPRQQLVHHTVSGCPIRPGDLFGSGTISGSQPDSYGSMLELNWKGSKEINLGKGETRKFLQDNDTVIITGYCQGPDYRIGFGTCQGKIKPSHS